MPMYVLIKIYLIIIPKSIKGIKTKSILWLLKIYSSVKFLKYFNCQMITSRSGYESIISLINSIECYFP